MKYLKYFNVIFLIICFLDCLNIVGKFDRCSWFVEKICLDIKVIWVLLFFKFCIKLEFLMVVFIYIKNIGELYLFEVMIGLNVLMLILFLRGLNFVFFRVYFD